MTKSILVENMDFCIFCGKPAEEHHVFFGNADRPIADKFGLTVPLCPDHHTGGKDSPHRNRIVDLALKCWAQNVYEKEIGDRNSFRKNFRMSYL